ncbi:hypothetical protein TgHK011_007264 [Trichoderma gracile]|nr:hypothetical protein TgHK011_007264 [Trichoderma gracile]
MSPSTARLSARAAAVSACRPLNLGRCKYLTGTALATAAVPPSTLNGPILPVAAAASALEAALSRDMERLYRRPIAPSGAGVDGSSG